MPRLNLPALSRANKRRKSVMLRPVVAPAMLATDLFRSCYLPVIQLWQEALPTILASYERSLAALTTDSPADVQADLNAVESAFERLSITLTPAIRSWALRVERSVRTRWSGAVLAATSVDLSAIIGPEDVRETLEGFIEWNVDLVRDVSAQTRKRIADRVFAGLNERKPAREVAREIREAVGMSRRRSLSIASDQLSKVSNALADERMREAGLTVWAWVHSGKRHPREQHKARDGFLYSDTDHGKKVGGVLVRKPPERGDRPGQPPYCACHQRGVLVWEFDDE